jgi:hypothetical protein
LLAKPSAARAGNGGKEDFHYQEHPNEGKHCANCAQFIPPEAKQQLGGCRIVAGPISADGWHGVYAETGGIKQKGQLDAGLVC